MQSLADLAAQSDRHVALVGRRMVRNSEIGCGSATCGSRLAVRFASRSGHYPAQHARCLWTGRQGEPMSALSLIAIDDHRDVKVGPDDTVVFSRASIPGNVKAYRRVINHLSRRGADVIHQATPTFTSPATAARTISS